MSVQNSISEKLSMIQEEANGERGIAYEKFGSGINEVLEYAVDIADLLKETHPELVEGFLSSLVSY